VHSRDYVREELAVFAMQAAERPAAEVYPGSNLQSAVYLLDRELPEAIRPLASRYFTRIDFARINLAPEADRRQRVRIPYGICFRVKMSAVRVLPLPTAICPYRTSFPFRD
ncbi:MAG: hypothetical protein WB764_02385, partial [Xanthobacteraceae bacterium]